MDPPALTCQAVGPTRGASIQKPKSIGNLGYALDFVAIGKLGNAMDFVTIGKIGNCSDIAKIANDFGWQHAFGGDGGGQPQIIGNIGKIVTPKKLA